MYWEKYYGYINSKRNKIILHVVLKIEQSTSQDIFILKKNMTDLLK